MAFKFVNTNKLIDGSYLGRIGKVEEAILKNGEEKTLIHIKPYDAETNEYYEEVVYWVNQLEEATGLVAQLFDALGIELDFDMEYNADALKSLICGKKVGLEISVNEKNGKTYNNITSFFPFDEDELPEDDEDSDEDDLDDLDEDEEEESEEDDEDEEDDAEEENRGFRRSSSVLGRYGYTHSGRRKSSIR